MPARRYSLVQELLFLPPQLTEDEFERLFPIIDRDGDGGISEQTWLDYFLTNDAASTMARPTAELYDPAKSDIKAFLIDLDGTLYTSGRLIPGARTFYKWLLDSRTPHVFVSNTGSKGPEGTQTKLLTPPYMIHRDPVPLSRIMTAADAQADYMVRTLPAGR